MLNYAWKSVSGSGDLLCVVSTNDKNFSQSSLSDLYRETVFVPHENLPDKKVPHERWSCDMKYLKFSSRSVSTLRGLNRTLNTLETAKVFSQTEGAALTDVCQYLINASTFAIILAVSVLKPF
jgi:hypothetical protein